MSSNNSKVSLSNEDLINEQQRPLKMHITDSNIRQINNIDFSGKFRAQMINAQATNAKKVSSNQE